MISLRRLLLLCALPSACLANYNTTSCTEGCIAADTQFNKCNFEDGPYGGYTSCICVWGGNIEIALGWLDSCVVCNEEGLGQQELSTYQEWSLICGTYKAQGAGVASSVAASVATTQLLAQWTTSLWPQIQTAEGGSADVSVATESVASTSSTATPTGASSEITSSGLSTTAASTSGAAQATASTSSTDTSDASATNLKTELSLYAIGFLLVFVSWS